MAEMTEPPPPYQKEDPVHKPRNGIPPQARRSMEDESRPLPAGWVRQYDVQHSHQYFVDTKAKPERSIWHHPFDDDQYLSTLSSEERERIQAMYKSPSREDIEAESTDEEDNYHPQGRPTSSDGPSSSKTQTSQQQQGKPSFGRKMKDKLTQSTHEERVVRRRQRAEEERQAYEQHMALRSAMNRAIQTGEPQLVGKDRQGHDLYIEPPRGPTGRMYGYPGSGANYRGYNPYQSGVYADPNARFLRPAQPYGRPYGMGYGGGYGMPLAGGLAGGLLLGGMLGAGF